jgi:1-deoxy-D-xylulose-5-phosphate synthase
MILANLIASALSGRRRPGVDNGAFVLQALAQHGALDRGLKIRALTLPDIFQDQDKPEAMYAAAGLDAEGIVRGALAALGVEEAARVRRA